MCRRSHGVPGDPGQLAEHVELRRKRLDVIVVQVQQLQACEQAERAWEGVDVVALSDEDLQAGQAPWMLSAMFSGGWSPRAQEVQLLGENTQRRGCERAVVAEVQLAQPGQVGEAGGQLGQAVVRQRSRTSKLRQTPSSAGSSVRPFMCTNRTFEALQEADLRVASSRRFPHKFRTTSRGRHSSGGTARSWLWDRLSFCISDRLHRKWVRPSCPW